MTIAHAHAIAEVRSCLAALADTAPTVGASAEYDRILIYFDGIVGDLVSAIRSLDETDPCRLFHQLEAAFEGLVTYGFDVLTAESLLDMAHGPADSAGPC